MTEFSDIVLGCFQAAGVRHIAEIGAEFGGSSEQFAAYAGVTGGNLTSIDPARRHAFVEWVKRTPAVRHIAAPSLEAMPGLSDVDAWVIDGDHNYYTVFNELRLADMLAQRDGKPLLCFLHDVGWPCGRRDFYCAPDRIPAQWRHPHSFEAGITLGDPGSAVGRGLRGAGRFAVALHEGGPHNGVLTAIEDFIRGSGTERALAFANVPAAFGLGILYDSSAPWAGRIAEILAPLHDNPLMASLERDRLRNDLAAIERQDRRAA
jgi:hypothetical protein